MELSDLDFIFPPELVATEPRRPSRVLLSRVSEGPQEVSVSELLDQIPAGDVLVINDTKVLPVRVWSKAGDEVLFVKSHDGVEWDVLYPARANAVGDRLEFPGGHEATLIAKGLPQRLRFDRELPAKFFTEFGEPALPPYIQAARGDRHAKREDFDWYQTAWARIPGSSAAPTASLHFSSENLRAIEKRGVKIAPLTLHVGLGTFLPVKGSLNEHKMHAEEVFIPRETIEAVEQAKSVWALGTTSIRALESWALGFLQESDDGFSGATELFIKDGFEFRVVNRLLTNFHQPKSTLLALVMAFAGKDRVKAAYDFAIQNKFRLFSYGDLSAWSK